MFHALKNFVTNLQERQKNNIDAARFNDEVALKTDWEPLNTSSSNFDTRKLSMEDRRYMKYKTTMGLKLFGGLFMVVGAAFLSFVGPRMHGRWLPDSFLEEGLAQLVCLLFIFFGMALLYFVSSPVEFDGRKGVFLKGRGKRRKSINFSEIHALQLIPKRVTDSDGPDYFNHQLNLVLNDASRIHIVDYYHAEKAKQDSKVIADLMNKKVWDAS